MMKINSANVEFIQEVKYAKSFINSSLFPFQYSSDLPTIIQSVFMVSIDLCVKFVVWKSLHWKGWNLKWNQNSEHEGRVMTIKLLHNLVLTHCA